MKEIGIYIHIPFCIKKCEYCDFVSYCNKEKYVPQYINALKKEIKNNINKEYKITTIYIGGGTPSSIEENYIAEDDHPYNCIDPKHTGCCKILKASKCCCPGPLTIIRYQISQGTEHIHKSHGCNDRRYTGSGYHQTYQESAGKSNGKRDYKSKNGAGNLTVFQKHTNGHSGKCQC